MENFGDLTMVEKKRFWKLWRRAAINKANNESGDF